MLLARLLINLPPEAIVDRGNYAQAWPAKRASNFRASFGLLTYALRDSRAVPPQFFLSEPFVTSFSFFLSFFFFFWPRLAPACRDLI